MKRILSPWTLGTIVLLLFALRLVALGVLPDAGVAEQITLLLTIFVAFMPLSGTVIAVYLWRLWRADPRRDPDGKRLRESLVFLFAYGVTMTVASALPVSYFALSIMFPDLPDVPDSAVGPVLGLGLLGPLLVVHIYAVYIWWLRRADPGARPSWK